MLIKESSELAIIIPAFLGVVTVVVGFGKMLTSHASDTTRHINSDSIVVKDTCESKHFALGKQLELLEQHNKERHDDLMCFLQKTLNGKVANKDNCSGKTSKT